MKGFVFIFLYVIVFIGIDIFPFIRDGPFNFQGGLWFYSKKNILFPNVAEKNILILVEEKKKSDSEFLSYKLMLKIL